MNDNIKYYYNKLLLLEKHYYLTSSPQKIFIVTGQRRVHPDSIRRRQVPVDDGNPVFLFGFRLKEMADVFEVQRVHSVTNGHSKILRKENSMLVKFSFLASTYITTLS